MISFVTIKVGMALAVVSLIFYAVQQHRRNRKLPPGPRPLPLIGNLYDLPPPGRAEYLHWIKFKDTYGPLSSITVMGQPMIIIHDQHAADVLLDKTSLKTSNRPAQPFSGMCGFNRMLPSMQYNTESRLHRKYIHQQLGTVKAASRFNNIQDVESKRLLLRTLVDPQNLRDHFKKEVSAVILEVTYGYATEPHGPDPLVHMIERMMENLSSAFVPLSWTVDIIPQLNYLPEWFPGAGFKKTAREWRQVTEGVCDLPFAFVQRQMAAGTHRPSYVSSLIESMSSSSPDGNLSAADEEVIKQTAAILYGGAADTTISTFNSFILAMLLFPDVQRKAQREIDEVVGKTRLPGFEDRDRLPYINALVKESLRWFPVVPIGTTHVVQEDFTYDGYLIPKGAYLLPAIRWLLHNPDVYAEPSDFEPGRFLAPRNEPDPAANTFGYGRRICPGRYLSLEGLYITIVRLLAAFDVTKAVDEEGKELHVPVEPMAGLICHPTPFPYVIKARSAAHEELIRAVEKEHPWGESDTRLLDADIGKV